MYGTEENDTGPYLSLKQQQSNFLCTEFCYSIIVTLNSRDEHQNVFMNDLGL